VGAPGIADLDRYDLRGGAHGGAPLLDHMVYSKS